MYRYLACILLSLFSFSGQVHAQKKSRKKKTEKQRPTEQIGIYLKKKRVYQFTKAEYLHFRDSINFKTNDALHKVNDHKIEWRPSKIPFKPLNAEPPVVEAGTAEPVNIYKNDRLVRSLKPAAYRRFKDSLALKTKDTLFAISDMRVEIHPYQPVTKTSKPVKPLSVFVNGQGYVAINLPLAKVHRYRVVFLADAVELFQINTVKEPELTLDKTNFIHAGWFEYEVYENERLKEKGKFFLPKG